MIVVLLAVLTASAAGYHLVPAGYDKGHESAQPADEKMSVKMAKTFARDGKVMSMCCCPGCPTLHSPSRHPRLSRRRAALCVVRSLPQLGVHQESGLAHHAGARLQGAARRGCCQRVLDAGKPKEQRAHEEPGCCRRRPAGAQARLHMALLPVIFLV